MALILSLFLILFSIPFLIPPPPHTEIKRLDGKRRIERGGKREGGGIKIKIEIKIEIENKMLVSWR